MTTLRGRWLPGAFLGVTLLLAVAELAMSAQRSQDAGHGLSDVWFAAAVFLPAVAFSAVGSFILIRRPGNRIGWLMIAIGVGFALSIFTSDYPGVTRHGHFVTRPLGAYVAWISAWIGVLPLSSLFLLLMLFPTGSLPGRRWTPVLWFGLLAWLGMNAGSALQRGSIDPGPVHNPFGIVSIPEEITTFLILSALLAMALAVLSLVLRFRSARGDVRQQLKWFTYGAVLAISLNFGGFLTSWSNAVVIALWLIAVTALPILMGMAILRYRLYDIDVLVNRTLVYGSLTVSLGLLYLGSVLGLQGLARAVTGQSSDLTVAVATLGVAALFNPWRRRLQSFIDRRFYRHKYDSVRTLASLSTRLRDDIDLQEVRTEILSVVQETVQPAHVSLWLP